MAEPVCLSFHHGLGDCCNFVRALQLWKRQGYDIRVQRSPDKDAVFEAGGIPSCDGGAQVHWYENPSFNKPSLVADWTGNKIFYNLAHHPLPPLKNVPVGGVWDELCDEVDLSDSLESVLDEGIKKAGESFAHDLPRPIIGLHTHGNTNPSAKNLPDATVKELYHRLLDAGCGLVVFDWDDRVPMLKDGRVRFIKRDWGYLSVLQAYSILRCCQCLVGIDSGIYHLCGLTKVPALLVTHQMYPTCVALPRPQSAVLTKKEHRALNIQRRRRWNVLEYEGSMPTAEGIARHTLRLACIGTNWSCPRGRSVMLQQWVKDWLQGDRDRHNTVNRALAWLYGNSYRFYANADDGSPVYDEPVERNIRIVETGCIRSQEDWSGAGNSTYLFAALCDSRKSLEFVSVDNSQDNVNFAREAVSQWRGNHEVVCMDSVRFLKCHLEKSIDLLYLDSLDTEDPQHAEHGLAEIQAAYGELSSSAVVVYDDTWYDGGWKGKGALGVPWLKQQGWRIVACGYQVVMQR